MSDELSADQYEVQASLQINPENQTLSFAFDNIPVGDVEDFFVTQIEGVVFQLLEDALAQNGIVATPPEI